MAGPFKIKTTGAVQIDGVGSFEKAGTHVVTQEQADLFELKHGYTLDKANFTDGTEVTKNERASNNEPTTRHVTDGANTTPTQNEAVQNKKES